MSSQLGFTFYPKDWWTSDSFFLLQPFERYIYLECLFMMYSNDGWMSNNKLIVERRLSTTIKDEVWDKITDLMVKEGDQITHKSVNKRLRKTLANRENGLKGGRPKNSEKSSKNTSLQKPKKPNEETQKNPPLEKEREKKENRIEIEDEVELKFDENYYINANTILNSNQRIIDLAAMQNKIEIGDVKILISDFITQKSAIGEKWMNESKMNQNFLLWIPKFLNAKNSKPQSNGNLQKAHRR